MKFDLEGALHEMARSAGADASAERISAQVGSMVARVRRRRAVRRTATGVVTVAAAGALAVVALDVPGLTGSDGGPAAPGPFEGDSQLAFGQCGSVPPEVVEDRSDLYFATGDDLGPFPVGGPMEVGVDLVNGRAERFVAGTSVQPHAVIVKDGVVVGQQAPMIEMLAHVDLEPGERLEQILFADLMRCDPEGFSEEPLPAGEYELYAVQTFYVDGGDPVALPPDAESEGLAAHSGMVDEGEGLVDEGEGVDGQAGAVDGQAGATEPQGGPVPDPEPGPPEQKTVIGGPWTITIDPDAPPATTTPPPADEPDPDTPTSDAPAAVTYPRCGDPMPTVDPDSPLRLVAEAPVDPSTNGGRFSVPAELSTTAGQRVIANVPFSGRAAIVQDGVVVGGPNVVYGDDVDVAELGPDDVHGLGVFGVLGLCDSDEMLLDEDRIEPLPPGDYQVVIMLEVALKEVTTPDGEAIADSRSLLVVDHPLPLVID